MPGGLGQNLLDHESVHVDEGKLDQVQGEHADLLIVDAVHLGLTVDAFRMLEIKNGDWLLVD